MQRKLVLVYVLIILAFVVLITRITVINAKNGDKYTKLVLDQQQYGSIHGLNENINQGALPAGVDFYKKMIEMLIKMLSKKKNRTADEDVMLEMIKAGGDFTKEENLAGVVEWYGEIKEKETV